MFRGVWGAGKRSSSSSSNGTGSSAYRSQSSRQIQGSARPATQRSRQGRKGQEQALAKGQGNNAAKDRGRFYWNITGFPFPLGPLLTRRTVRYEVSTS